MPNKNNILRCSNCGASDIKFDEESGKLKCQNCRSLIDGIMANEADDIRSSNHLELPATEFDIQGLEIDYSIVCWDANLRYIDGEFVFKEFNGDDWNNINQDIRKNYLLNAIILISSFSK